MYQSLSLASFIETWLNTFKSTSVKQSTYDRLQTSLKALEGFTIASKAIGEITAVDIQNYVNDLTQCGYELSTIKKQMRIVTAPLKQAKRKPGGFSVSPEGETDFDDSANRQNH